MPATRRRLGIPPVAFWLVFILLGMGAFLSLDQRDDLVEEPSVVNRQPSGLSAWADVLTQTVPGFRVDRTIRPKLGPRDLAIIPVRTSLEYTREELLEALPSSLAPAIERHAAQGGVQLWIVQPAFIAPENTPLTTVRLRGHPDRAWDVTVDPLTERLPPGATALVSDRSRVYVGVLQERSLMTVVATHQLVANGQLDQGEHAGLMDSLVRALRDPTGQVVLVDGAAGSPEDPGLLFSLHPAMPWVVGQMLLAFVAVVLTYGRRFGLPEPDLTHERVGRELLDAFGDLMARSKRVDLACQLVLTHMDQEVRRAANIASSASNQDRNLRIPESVSQELDRLAVMGSDPDTSAAQASRQVQRTWDAVVAAYPPRFRSAPRLRR